MLLIVGKSCTGKTTILKKLSKEGYICLEGSEVVRTIQREKGYKNILERCGKDIVARYIHEEYKELGTNAIISGLRTEDELNYLKQHYPVYTVALYISDKESYRRTIERKREQFDSFQDFYLNKICYDYSLGLASLYKKSDLFIQEESLTMDEIYSVILSAFQNKLWN